MTRYTLLGCGLKVYRVKAARNRRFKPSQTMGAGMSKAEMSGPKCQVKASAGGPRQRLR